jgi:UTP--glucose-1-phosphate uridylyltransferase
MEVNGADISKYGVVVPGDTQGAVAGLVEKPDAASAPSNLASIGRYVLTPDVFDILRSQPPGAGGEYNSQTPSTPKLLPALSRA